MGYTVSAAPARMSVQDGPRRRCAVVVGGPGVGARRRRGVYRAGSRVERCSSGGRRARLDAIGAAVGFAVRSCCRWCRCPGGRSACVRSECWAGGRACALLRAGAGLRLLLHQAGGRPVVRERAARRGARAALPRRQPGRADHGAGTVAGRGQLPARRRPRRLADRPLDLRRGRLPRRLAGDRPGPSRRWGQAQVRVPPGAGSDSRAHPARLRRCHRAVGRLGRRAADRHGARDPAGRGPGHLPADRRQAGGRREQLRAHGRRRVRVRARVLQPPSATRDRPRTRLLHLPRGCGFRGSDGGRGRRGRQRVRHGSHDLN